MDGSVLHSGFADKVGRGIKVRRLPAKRDFDLPSANYPTFDATRLGPPASPSPYGYTEVEEILRPLAEQARKWMAQHPDAPLLPQQQ